MSLSIFGQDVIIQFEGIGESETVTNVEVVNLSNCTSIEVPDGYTTGETEEVLGVKEFEYPTSNDIHSYPSPFKELINIEFYISQNDNIKITVSNISGQKVAEINKDLKTGIHSFNFTTNNFGMFFITISGNYFSQSTKVISLGKGSQKTELNYQSQIFVDNFEKNYKNTKAKDFSWSEGDMLKLKGISGEYDYATVLVVEPTVSETYIFEFVECEDGDGNNYAVLEMSEQLWMAENLAYESPSCWSYGDNEDNVEDYGRLYDWETANTVCPDG